MAYLGNAPKGNLLTMNSSQFSGDNSETNFTLSQTVTNTNEVEVFVGNVRQDPHSAYTISGSTITFTGAPASSDTFFGVVLGDTLDIGTPSDSTVSASSLSSSFFVKNNQTLSSLSLSASENALLVGTVTVSGTITIPSGSTVVIV